MVNDVKCPICGSVTIVRTAKKGPNSGKKYNVCNRYPECKGQVSFRPKHSLLKRKDKPSLSELQGVPEGTFRCDVCKFVQPAVCLCGLLFLKSEGVDALKSYELCGVCAIWLDFENSRFPQGFCICSSDERYEKINTIHKELEINKVMLDEIIAMPTEDHEVIHEHISQIPNLNELIRLRWSLLSKDNIELSGKLTRGEYVEPSEISKANRNR